MAPHHRRRIVRPKRRDARKASLCATAPGVLGFHGLAFWRGGLMAAAPRVRRWRHGVMASRYVAGVEGAVGGDSGDFLIVWDLFEKLGQYPSPVRSKLVAVTGSTSPTSLWCARKLEFPMFSRQFPLLTICPTP